MDETVVKAELLGVLADDNPGIDLDEALIAAGIATKGFLKAIEIQQEWIKEKEN